jgi:four helix bundle protein
MTFAFEKLLVYQKAIDFSDRVFQLTSSSRRGFWFLADQLNRAALSIARNLAAATNR